MKADIFAMGVTLLEMCNAARLGGDKGIGLYEMRKENGQEPIYDQMLDAAKERYPGLAHIIDAVLAVDPEQRPTSNEIL